jgi:hypothetical protein
MTRLLILLAAFTLAAPTAASAAISDGTSNTVMFAEFQHKPGFMDYTDDVGFSRAGGQEGEE